MNNINLTKEETGYLFESRVALTDSKYEIDGLSGISLIHNFENIIKDRYEYCDITTKFIPNNEYIQEIIGTDDVVLAETLWLDKDFFRLNDEQIIFLLMKWGFK